MLVAAVQDALKGGEQLGERDLGEEAQAPEVHAQDGHGSLEQAAGREQGAVASEHDQGVGPGRDLAPGKDAAGLGRLGAAEGGGRLVEDRGGSALAQPADEVADGVPGLDELGAGQDADRGHGATAFESRSSSRSAARGSPSRARSRKNSRLPSAPGTGEAQASRAA